MIELRWLFTPAKIGSPEERIAYGRHVLQYRVIDKPAYRVLVGEKSEIEAVPLADRWSDWRDVPTVSEESEMKHNQRR